MLSYTTSVSLCFIHKGCKCGKCSLETLQNEQECWCCTEIEGKPRKSGAKKTRTKKEVKSEGEAPQGDDPKKDGQETTNTNILNKLLQTILLSTF